MKTFLFVFAALEVVALVYAAWYHLTGRDFKKR